MLPMIKLVENYKLSLYFQTSGVILPRKYSLIKVFENRFLYNRGDLRAQAPIFFKFKRVRAPKKRNFFINIFQKVPKNGFMTCFFKNLPVMQIFFGKNRLFVLYSVLRVLGKLI